MDNGRFIGELTGLGLTTYEARAYIALLGRDSFTAAQIAKRAGLPRQRIYDVLGTLVEKGLATARPGGVVKYAAVAPEIGIERLVAVRRDEMRRTEASATDMIHEMMPAYRSGLEHTDPLEYIEVLREAGAINARFAELQANVKREILVFTKPPYATPPQENVEGLEVTRSHTARSVYEYSVFDDPAVAAGVRRFIEAGEEARFVEQLPLKLVIIDEDIGPVRPRGPGRRSRPDHDGRRAHGPGQRPEDRVQRDLGQWPDLRPGARSRRQARPPNRLIR